MWKLRRCFRGITSVPSANTVVMTRAVIFIYYMHNNRGMPDSTCYDIQRYCKQGDIHEILQFYPIPATFL